MARVNIDGVGVVELDDSFLQLTEAEKQRTVDEIFAKHSNRSKPKPRLTPVAARALETSSGLEKANSIAKGINVGFLADMGGLNPFDLANSLLSAVGLGTDEPYLGSKSIRRALKAGGMGYMDESELPEDQRSLARGGRTVGGGVATMTPVFQAAKGLSAAQALAPRAVSQSVKRKTIPKETTETAISKIGTFAKELAPSTRSALSEMVKTTARSPLKMAALEGSALASAGTFRALSEEVGPARS